MTTIATDGKSMAGDGLVTSIDIVFHRAKEKIVRLKDGSIAGGAGNTGDILNLITWIEEGGKPPKVTKTRVLVLRPDGKIELAEGGEHLVTTQGPVAIGSGGDIAIGAMEAGATPREAVEIAARRDPFTGGEITVLEPRL